jgi:hypothetical protein
MLHVDRSALGEKGEAIIDVRDSHGVSPPV